MERYTLWVQFLKHCEFECTYGGGRYGLSLCVRFEGIPTYTDVGAVDQGRGAILLMIGHLVPVLIGAVLYWTEETL